MKKLEAVIQPFKLDEVKDALACEGIVGMTISEVRKSSAMLGRARCYRGVEYAADLLPKLKIELVLADDVARRAVEIVRMHARTGRGDDGDLVLAPVDEAIRIRTGERDDDVVRLARHRGVRVAAVR